MAAERAQDVHVNEGGDTDAPTEPKLVHARGSFEHSKHNDVAGTSLGNRPTHDKQAKSESREIHLMQTPRGLLASVDMLCIKLCGSREITRGKDM